MAVERYFKIDDDMPLYRHTVLLVIFTFFVSFIIWSNWSTLDEITRGDGKVVPSSEVQSVQSLDAGIVEEFLVKEGDQITAGQILMRLSDIEASSDLGANKTRYLGLVALTTRLQAEANGQKKLIFPPNLQRESPNSVAEQRNAFNANRRRLDGQLAVLRQQITQREQEIQEAQTRINDLRDVLQLLRDEKNVIAPLVQRGAAPQIELLQLDRSIKEKETDLNATLGSIPRAKSAVREAKARLNEAVTTAKADAQEQLSSRLVEMNEIKERLTALTERKTRTELRAPVSGTIQEITINSVGGVVQAGADVIRIVPTDDLLIVEAKIKPSDRAFIYPGQSAVVKITAYDFSIYGGLTAEVFDISADSITDDQGQSFYRVRLRTDEKELTRKGQVLPIIPGMIAQVDILTGKKTVLQYLMKPFIKTLDNAMNER